MAAAHFRVKNFLSPSQKKMLGFVRGEVKMNFEQTKSEEQRRQELWKYMRIGRVVEAGGNVEREDDG